MNFAIISQMLLCVTAGLALGAIFFGGLWLTVKRLPASAAPGLLVFGSLIVRLTILLTGLFFVMQGDWRRLLFCLLGVVVARFAVTALLGPGCKHALGKHTATHEPRTGS